MVEEREQGKQSRFSHLDYHDDHFRYISDGC